MLQLLLLLHAVMVRVSSSVSYLWSVWAAVPTPNQSVVWKKRSSISYYYYIGKTVIEGSYCTTDSISSSEKAEPNVTINPPGGADNKQTLTTWTAGGWRKMGSSACGSWGEEVGQRWRRIVSVAEWGLRGAWGSHERWSERAETNTCRLDYVSIIQKRKNTQTGRNSKRKKKITRYLCGYVSAFSFAQSQQPFR